MSERLPAEVEVAGIMRRAQGEGGFATILHRGDADRGAISLLVTERGRNAAVLERQMGPDFAYRWAQVPSSVVSDGSSWREWIAKKSQIDPDCWLVELDIADAQRFIAETTSAP